MKNKMNSTKKCWSSLSSFWSTKLYTKQCFRFWTKTNQRRKLGMPSKSRKYFLSKKWTWAPEFASTEKPPKNRKRKTKRKKVEPEETPKKYQSSWWSKITPHLAKILATISLQKTPSKLSVPSKSHRWKWIWTLLPLSTILLSLSLSICHSVSSSAILSWPKEK